MLLRPDVAIVEADPYLREVLVEALEEMAPACFARAECVVDFVATAVRPLVLIVHLGESPADAADGRDLVRKLRAQAPRPPLRIIGLVDVPQRAANTWYRGLDVLLTFPFGLDALLRAVDPDNRVLVASS